jgi:hypothetical protein
MKLGHACDVKFAPSALSNGCGSGSDEPEPGAVVAVATAEVDSVDDEVGLVIVVEEASCEEAVAELSTPGCNVKTLLFCRFRRLSSKVSSFHDCTTGGG